MPPPPACLWVRPWLVAFYRHGERRVAATSAACRACSLRVRQYRRGASTQYTARRWTVDGLLAGRLICMDYITHPAVLPRPPPARLAVISVTTIFGLKLSAGIRARYCILSHRGSNRIDSNLYVTRCRRHGTLCSVANAAVRYSQVIHVVCGPLNPFPPQLCPLSYCCSLFHNAHFARDNSLFAHGQQQARLRYGVIYRSPTVCDLQPVVLTKIILKVEEPIMWDCPVVSCIHDTAEIRYWLCFMVHTDVQVTSLCILIGVTQLRKPSVLSLLHQQGRSAEYSQVYSNIFDDCFVTLRYLDTPCVFLSSLFYSPLSPHFSKLQKPSAAWNTFDEERGVTNGSGQTVSRLPGAVSWQCPLALTLLQLFLKTRVSRQQFASKNIIVR
ncbi:hypothetical protein J6590_002439 [Homalodisca vitripennis]|nr:hypothetical protein J6590_002439 [Homalodisca vitripennis]